MGGEGSGRKPDIFRKILEQEHQLKQTPIGANAVDVFNLPNYSGLKDSSKKTYSNALPIAEGGTNSKTQTNNGVMYFNGTSIKNEAQFTYDESTNILSVDNLKVDHINQKTPAHTINFDDQATFNQNVTINGQLYASGANPSYFSTGISTSYYSSMGSTDFDGDVTITGSLTSGGSDPPYLLYFDETRSSVLEQCRLNIPQSRANGLVTFYNKDTDMMEYFKPSNCSFYKLGVVNGEIKLVLIETIQDGKAGYNTNTTTKYYWDKVKGQVSSYQKPIKPNIEIPTNKVIDSNGTLVDDVKPQ